MRVGSYLSQSFGILLLSCIFFAPNSVLADSGKSLHYTSSFQKSKFPKSNFGRSSYSSAMFRRMGKKKSKILWNLGMEAESLSSALNLQSQTASFGARVKFRHKLVDTLSLRADGKMQFQAGRTQDLFGDLEPDSGLYLKQAVLNWSVIPKFVNFKVGVLNQSYLANPLLIKSLGFPGARESFRILRKRWTLGLTAQQLIPTSSTLSTRVQEKEKTPTFYTETLEGTLGLTETTWLLGRYTLFNYNNLPSVVAYRSQIYGNTYRGGDINNAQFAFDFDGWMSQFAVEQRLTESVAVRFGVSFLRNEAALDRFNESQIYSLSAAFDTGRWIYTPSIENYFIEPDASPGFYNDFLRGHNNRLGWGAGFYIESKDNNFRVGTRFFDSKLLNKDTALGPEFQQDNLKTFSITVGTSYAGV